MSHIPNSAMPHAGPSTSTQNDSSGGTESGGGVKQRTDGYALRFDSEILPFESGRGSNVEHERAEHIGLCLDLGEGARLLGRFEFTVS